MSDDAIALILSLRSCTFKPNRICREGATRTRVRTSGEVRMVMREISIAKARDELTSLPERLTKKPGTLAVTRRGKPVLAVMPWELYESIIETLEIMGDQELMATLRLAIQEVAEGKTIPWEEVKRELNLDLPDRTD